jgi:hypothetical protein
MQNNLPEYYKELENEKRNMILTISCLNKTVKKYESE